MRAILKSIFYLIYYPASFVWRRLDRTASWRETRWWIDHLPSAMFTSATYVSYAGWAMNQGFFSALMSVYLEKPNPRILDFGCGMGGMAPIAYHFVKDGGRYLGIDTDRRSIQACLDTYGDLTNCEFYRTRDPNAWYPQGDVAPSKPGEIDWPVKPATQDLVIAMSVFTHLQEKDAVSYLNKILDVLAPNGLAFLSFAIIRKYQNPHFIYRFNHPLTPGWFCARSECPELSIGVQYDALLRLLGDRFKILKHIEGAVTGGRHPFLQDLFVLQKV